MLSEPPCGKILDNPALNALEKDKSKCHPRTIQEDLEGEYKYSYTLF